MRIWFPLFPAAFLGAGLVGWAIQEPKITDELLHDAAIIAVPPFLMIWIRAAVRAFRAYWSRVEELPAVTHGFVQRRIHISKDLASQLAPDALRAAYHHEAAHADHHDPIRIWLAQIATDLQWPLPGAKKRFQDWLTALEMARDDEARRRGADGVALAEAILTAARLMPCPKVQPRAASITGGGDALKERVERLLGPLPAEEPHRRARVSLARSSVCAAGIAFGILWGDEFVRALPMIVPL
jgi:beta-lactamase regulating signal transducer with metallopeptidase domain